MNTPDTRRLSGGPSAIRPLLAPAAGFLLLACLAVTPARALETVMQDDFSGNLSGWTVSPAGDFTVSSGALTGALAANAAEAYTEVTGFSGKDVVVEFDLKRFSTNGQYFDLVLRQNGGGNTRVRFALSSNRITAAIMEPGSTTTSSSLGQTGSLSIGTWTSFRVRVNDARVQVFTKTQAGTEYTLMGEYAPAIPGSISANAGAVRLLIPQSAVTNAFTLDNFKIRQADSGKQVFADFHIFRYTRENDGQLGNWALSIKSPQAPNHIANYNADLMDVNGVHELAAPGNPAVGMQSYNDEDYLEYHVLTAKMAGIDGFLYEYGGPSAGLTDSDLQKLQAVAETYDFKIGINWLDALYYMVIESDADYQAWCLANSKVPTDAATKNEYVPQVFQKLITWVYDKPNAAKVGGKPLLPIFNGSAFSASDLATLKTKTYNFGGASNVPSPFLIPRRAPMGLAASDPNVQKFWSDSSGWESHADGTFGWKPMTERPISSSVYGSQGDERDAKEFARAHVEGLLKTTNDRVNIAGVMPGFDNQFCAAWGSWKVELLDRKNGLTYTEVWDQYLRDRDVIDAVLIPTWTDHAEASGIEPTAPYGDREARATAKYSSQFKGLADTSASLDFSLPKELFELRKLAKFLESSGCPTALLTADRASLDAAAQDIAAASYTAAASKLADVRTNLDTRRTNGIIATTHSSQYFTGGSVTVANGADQSIDIPDATADTVRSKHFDGVITFEYLDNSTFDANKSLFLISNPSPANTGKPGEWRDVQMQLRHGNGSGQWKTARVALNKKNLRLDHHVTPGAAAMDLYFSTLGGASNGGTIRNVTVALTTYEYTFLPGDITNIPPDISLTGGTNDNYYAVTSTNAGVNGWGTLNGNFNAASQFLISPNTTSGPLTFNGVISGVNGIQIQPTSSNPVIFNGANTFEGNLNLAGAWLRIGNATALGSTAGATSFKNWNGPASYLDINGQTVVGETLFHGYWDGVVNSQLLNSSASTATWTGNVILGTQTRFSAAGAGNLVISGNISDDVAGATIQVDASGGGKVVFSGNNTNTGWIVVANSWLVAGSAQAFGTAASPTAIPSWTAWGVVDVNGQHIAGETFQNDLANGVLANFAATNATWGGSVLANAHLRFIVGGTGDLNITGAISGTTIQADSGGGGTLVLSGINIYTGDTIIYDAKVRLGHANALGTTAGVTGLNGPGSQLDINGLSIVGETLINNQVNGYLFNSSAGNASWSGSITANQQLLLQTTGAGSLELSGVISGVGSMQIQPTGGAVILSGSNSFEGPANLNGSLVKLGNANALGNTTGPTNIVGGEPWGNYIPSTLDLNGFTVTGETLNIGFTNGRLTNSAATGATWAGDIIASEQIVMNSGAGGLTVSGAISGASSIHVDGGAVTLSGSNTYSGETLISAGTLSVSQAGFADAADIRIVGSAVLNLNFSGADVIDEFLINGVKQAGGTWGAVGSGAEHQSPLITGTGFLEVGNGAIFSDWATQNGIPGELPGDDFDHDGIVNLLEYALGLNPTVPNASPGSFDGTTISFNKGSAAVANGDVAYAIQTSTTLAAGSWVTVTPAVNSPLVISYTLPSNQSKIFARLVVIPLN